MAVIESAGSTSLDTDSSNRYLIANSIYVRYGGAQVSTTTFGAWTALGAEFIGTGYRIVWKNGSADQYVVWTTDSAGNWLSQTAAVNGASATIRSLEPGFNQNLNGTGGIESSTLLDNSAATRLYTVAGGYGLSPVTGLLGPQLRYGGALVAAGQFGNWTPLGAELINGNYRVVWRNGVADQYVVWLVDSNGNWLTQTAVVSGSSAEIRSLEAGFGQDLNNSGGIDSASAIIDSAGGTRVSNIAGVYVLSPAGSSLGPQLRYNGSLVTPTTFGSWTPLGAELINGNYRVVWKNGGLDQYVVWLVDSNGNWVSQTAIVNGSSAEIRSLEPGFNQNLNGTGGIEARTPIEVVGSTELASVANTYVLSPSGSSLGPQLRYGAGGPLVTPTTFGNWTPLGAEANGSNYAVVWKNGVLDQYVVWNVDGNGNWLSQTAIVSGTSADIRTLEAAFNQNLNGTGGIDSRTAIEASGFSTLASIANFYTLAPTGNLIGQVLKMNGAAVTSGQFGNWTPLAVEMSGGMYRLAWKNGAADQFIGWNIDAAGNLVSMGPVVTGGTTWFVESYENIVVSDLNGDGRVGPTFSAIEAGGATTLYRVADSYFFNWTTQAAVQVQLNGTYVGVTQFGNWTPLAAEWNNGMYRLAWKNGGLDQYIAWNIDSSGNTQSMGAVVSGSTWYCQTYENIVGADLNSDGIVGPTVTTIETSGASTLIKVADSYFINNGVQVLYGGSYAGSNQFANWTAVGAEQTIGSYMVAWRNSSSGNYTVWNLDGSGNYVWNSAEYGAGSAAFFAIEATFQQDFNGGGILSRSTVEGSGTTALYNASGYLQMVRGPYTGPLLSIGANFVTATQYGTAMGAEWNGGGYVVAWKTGTDTYNFWNTDASGRFSTQTGNLAGSSAQMQNYEPTFNQDLNGDGVIGINNMPFDIQFRFSGNTSYNGYFEQAAQKWERIIRGDLPSVTHSTYGVIDDLLITASVQTLSTGILGQANWDLRRTGTGGLPYLGHMTFNSIYMDQMVRDGILTSVIAHEMGHVLGIGTLWNTFGLTSGFNYIGGNAVNAYRSLGGTGQLLIENVGGSGSVGSHWRESVYDRELMTSVSETRDPMPLSVITIGSLADMGYTVNYGAADGYGLPVTNLEVASSSSDSTATMSDAAALYASGNWCGCGCMGSSSSALSSYSFATAADGGGVINPDANAGACAAPLSDAGVANPDAYAAGCMAPGSEEGVANPDAYAAGCMAPGSEVGDVSLLTTYLANSFVASPGEGASGDATASSSMQDFLTRPVA